MCDWTLLFRQLNMLRLSCLHACPFEGRGQASRNKMLNDFMKRDLVVSKMKDLPDCLFWFFRVFVISCFRD